MEADQAVSGVDHPGEGVDTASGQPGADPSRGPAPGPGVRAVSRTVGGDDALHPVRRLRRALATGSTEPRSGRPDRPAPAVAPAGAHRLPSALDLEPTTTPPPAEGETAPRRVRGGWHRRPAVGVTVLAIVVAAASTGVVLLRAPSPVVTTRPPAPPTISAPDGPVTTFAPGTFAPGAQIIYIPAGGEPTLPSSVPNGVGNLRMYSQTTGWAQRLSDGSVLHTTQGVKGWTVVSPPQGGVLAVAYLGPEQAQAITAPTLAATGGLTNQVTSWSTGDGGSTWVLGASFAVPGQPATGEGELDFVNSLDGWFSEVEVTAANGEEVVMNLFRTVDGGARWSPVSRTVAGGQATQPAAGVIPSGCTDLPATFVSPTTGWITADCSAGTDRDPPVWVTHDGGLTWSQQTLAGSAATSDPVAVLPPYFSSPEHGVLVVSVVAADGLTSVYVTGDGGSTWVRTPASLPPGSAAGLAFGGSANDGWLVIALLDGSTVFSTTDGGDTWVALPPFPGYPVSLSFAGGGEGWACLDSSQITEGSWSNLLQTADGGQTWTAVAPVIIG